MNKNEISEFARRTLTGLLERPGSILYSSHETLKPGDVYLLGFNPGGSGGNPLEQSIDSILLNESNAYLDECWDKPFNQLWDQGQAPLQRRICWILESLNLNPREVCASNLIFIQSHAASDVSFDLAKICWPVHEAILSVIKPKLIIAFGNSEVSPYGYLHNMFGGIEESMPSGHGNWLLKRFRTNINGDTVYIAGLPHLSRYSPIGKKHVTEWLYKCL